MLVCVLLVLVTSASAALPLPPYLKACSRHDPNLNECGLRSAIAAIPDMLKGNRKYNSPSLDPLKIPEVNVTQPGGLDIVFRNLEIHGLRDVVIKSVSIDFNGRHFNFNMFVPIMAMLSDYEVDGKVLVLPIKGAGRSNITMVDLYFNYTSDYDLVKKTDGLEYFNPKNPLIKFKAGRAYIDLSNLFNGDKFLGETTNKFLNENSEVVIQEMGPAMAEAIATVSNAIVANLADLVPFDTVFPEKV